MSRCIVKKLCLVLLMFVGGVMVIRVDAQVATPGALNTALGVTAQGTITSLAGVDPLSCPQIGITPVWDGGRLIFSDSPESPAASGMLYMDTNLPASTASLTNRIFVYHVNSNSASQMRFSVLLKNNGASSGTLTISRSGIAGPSTDYPYVGQVCFYRWLTNAPNSVVTVAAGQTVRLDSSFDVINVPLNYLLHGIWDYTFTQPHTLMICALKTTDNPLTIGPTLSVIARDGHKRGTFTNCNRLFNTTSGTGVNTSQGIQQFPLGGSGDVFVAGYDNAVAVPTRETNGGNYGVLYKCRLGSIAADGRAEALLINPRGGAWSGALNTDVGLLPGGSFLIPGSGATFSDNTTAAIAGEYLPGSSGTNISFLFMPTGGASFPVRLLTVPFNPVYPTLSAIGNFQINPGQTVTFTAVGADLNTNKTLTYSLASAPASATIGFSNGHFQWRAPVSSSGISNTLQVRVSDGSTPSLTATRNLGIYVNPLTPVTMTTSSHSSVNFQLQVTGTVGPDYILQAKGTPDGSVSWSNIQTNTPTASPFVFTDTDSGGFTNRFYRVLLGP